MKLKHWLLIMSIFTIFTGCNSLHTIPTATISHSSQVTPKAIPANLPNLREILQISNVVSITLEDTWMGYADDSPINSSYSMLPTTTEFIGHTIFQVGGHFKKTVVDVQTFHVPAKNIQSFLDKLAETSFTEGIYKPLVEWTDDYPYLEIDIFLQTGRLFFSTSSQGDQHTPWSMIYNNRGTYIIASSTPMDAINQLGPYLQRDRLKEIKDQVMKEPRPVYPTQNITTPTLTP